MNEHEGETLQVSFSIGSSGFGGAGWIGKVEGKHMGVYFGHPQEYTTSDEHMIDALEKSGVATKLYEEWVPDEKAIGSPTPVNPLDEDGQVKELEFMKLIDLKTMAAKMGLSLNSKMKKNDVIDAIREERGESESE